VRPLNIVAPRKIARAPPPSQKKARKTIQFGVRKGHLESCPTQTYRLTHPPTWTSKLSNSLFPTDSVKIMDLGGVTSGGDSTSIMD